MNTRERVANNPISRAAEIVSGLPSIYLAIALLVVFVALFYAGNSSFLSAYNITSILSSAAILFTVGAGVTWAIITGGIDLSIGGLMSLAAVVFIVSVGHLGYWAYPLCILLGDAAGFANGQLLTRVKIPSFIVTLGMGGVFVSAAYLITPKALLAPPEAYKILDLINGKLLGIDNIVFIAALFFGFFFFIQRFTVIGRNIFYSGSNIKMSWLSGIDVTRTKSLAFMFSGIGASAAGVMLAGRQYSGYPTIGEVYLLMGIATAIIGGTAMTGGNGGVVNTLVGALIMSVLQNGMTVVGIDVHLQQSILGALVIATVAISIDRKKLAIIK